MKVVAFNGSGRRDGNTARLILYVFEELKKEGIETEMVQLAGQEISGCRVCFSCMKNKNRRCAIDKDIVNECIEKMIEADGIILGSPTYFADLSAQIKALIDRSGFVVRANDNLLRRKVGAAVVAARRGGAIHTFDSLNHFFLIAEMIIPGSIYWNLGIGKEAGEVEKDEEAFRTMTILGKNMAWLLKKIHG